MRNFDDKYIKISQIWATNSYAKRKKVGAIIVKNNRIISDGYNGTPKGFPNECEESYCDSTERCQNRFYSNACNDCEHCKMRSIPYVLHAEANAIAKLAKSTESGEDATLYVTMSPCLECAKLIIQTGIKRVVYLEEYRMTDGLELLSQAGIEVVKFDSELL